MEQVSWAVKWCERGRDILNLKKMDTCANNEQKKKPKVPIMQIDGKDTEVHVGDIITTHGGECWMGVWEFNITGIVEFDSTIQDYIVLDRTGTRYRLETLLSAMERCSILRRVPK